MPSRRVPRPSWYCLGGDFSQRTQYPPNQGKVGWGTQAPRLFLNCHHERPSGREGSAVFPIHGPRHKQKQIPRFARNDNFRSEPSIPNDPHGTLLVQRPSDVQLIFLSTSAEFRSEE